MRFNLFSSLDKENEKKTIGAHHPIRSIHVTFGNFKLDAMHC